MQKNWNLPLFIECFDNEILYNKKIDLKDDIIFKSYKAVLSKIESLSINFIDKEYDLVISINGGSFISYNDKEMNVLSSLTISKVNQDNKNALDNLLKLSAYVKKDGYLLFYSDSIIYEQSLGLQQEFLNKCGTDYELVTGRYILPSESDSRSSYYCIFRRRR